MKTVKFLLFLFIYNFGFAQGQIFQTLSASKVPELQEVFKDTDKHELQILYSSITRDGKGGISFEDAEYKVDDSLYFYPASTVKLPVAVLALEKINEIRDSGIPITKNTEYHFLNDSISHTIASDIRSIFAVSDNDAYNRLFEFMGQDYINKKLQQKGLKPVRISHRFSGETSLDTLTRQLIFQLENSEIYELPVTYNAKAVPLRLKGVEKGKAYMENDSLQESAFNFSLKNYFPLRVQHQLMKQLFFPQEFQEKERFGLTEDDRTFLFEAMSAYPRQAGYDDEEFYDSYGKFFLFGDSEEPITSNIRIFNKVGYAYGTLTETAYIYDPDNDVEFILSATLLVNENEIFNDNQYEYDSIGIPFLAELGRQIHEYELSKRNN